MGYKTLLGGLGLNLKELRQGLARTEARLDGLDRQTVYRIPRVTLLEAENVDMDNIASHPPISLKPGSIYLVRCNGLEYYCPACRGKLDGAALSYIGNPVWVTGENDGLPFTVMSNRKGASVLATQGRIDHLAVLADGEPEAVKVCSLRDYVDTKVDPRELEDLDRKVEQVRTQTGKAQETADAAASDAANARVTAANAWNKITHTATEFYNKTLTMVENGDREILLTSPGKKTFRLSITDQGEVSVEDLSYKTEEQLLAVTGTLSRTKQLHYQSEVLDLVPGRSYNVYWKGKRYSCTAFRQESPLAGPAISLGNQSYLGGKNTGEPFVVLVGTNTQVMAMEGTEGEQITIRITRVKET